MLVISEVLKLSMRSSNSGGRYSVLIMLDVSKSFMRSSNLEAG